jgi:hypothetical protein
MRVWVRMLLVLLPPALWGQYKADAAGAPPAELEAEIASSLSQHGFLVTKEGAKYCELWFEGKLPRNTGPADSKDTVNVSLPDIPSGALLGIIRFDARGEDRRGQAMEPGLYMLRYARLPANADHEGTAAQRDFLVLTPATEDRDPKPPRDFDALVALSLKASHTRHPAVLSFQKAASDSPGFSQKNDTDWVLETEIGDTPVAIIVAGVAGS